MPSHLVLAGVAATITLVTAACASAPEQRSAGDCSLAPADSAFIGAQPLYRDCSVDRPARPVTTRVDFTPTVRYQPGTTCFSAEVQFVVGTDGRPEQQTVRLVQAGADGFSDAVLAAVSKWVYTPAIRDGVPVRQLVRQRSVAAVAVVAVPANQARGATPPRPPNCN